LLYALFGIKLCGDLGEPSRAGPYSGERACVMKRDRIRLLLFSDLHYNHHGRRWETTGETKGSEVFKGPLLLKAFKEALMNRSAAVDHVIISGDLTNNGYDLEYKPIVDALADFDGRSLSVIPGNHDMSANPLTNIARWKFKRSFFDHFDKYMFGSAVSGARVFPYVKEVGDDILIVGMDTTSEIQNRFQYTMLWFSASVGEIGKEQIESVRKILEDKRYADRWAVIVMHHDPFVFQNPWTKLGDLNKFKAMLDDVSRKRKIIVVCGHNHYGKIDHYNKNVLHIQAPAFCGQRANEKGRFHDIVIKSDLTYTLIKK
jgi:3',5'-cyclic AMP phosphodiesterase CpdA